MPKCSQLHLGVVLNLIKLTRVAMKTPEGKAELSLYVPKTLIKELDNKRGPFSRTKLIVLLLEAAVREGVDLGKLVRNTEAASDV